MADSKVQGIDAKNQDFIRFDQVNKLQEYRLAEAEDRESFDEAYQIRTVDISRFLRGDQRDRRDFADRPATDSSCVGRFLYRYLKPRRFLAASRAIDSRMRRSRVSGRLAM